MLECVVLDRRFEDEPKGEERVLNRNMSGIINFLVQDLELVTDDC